MRRAFLVLLAGVASTAVVLGWAAPAQAATAAARTAVGTVDVEATLSREGVLTVKQTFELSSSGPSTLSQEIPRRTDRDGSRYSYDLSDVAVTVDGEQVSPTLSRTPQTTRLTVPAQGATTVVVEYTVTGATVATVDGRVDLTWPLLDGLNVDVARVTGEVQVPAGAVNYVCQAGVPGALLRCSTYSGGTHGSTALTFTHHQLAAGQSLQASVLFADGMVTVTEQVVPVRTLGRAFTVGWAQLGAMAGVLVVGAVLLLLGWRRVRTAGYRGTPVVVAELTGDDGHVALRADPSVRPGMVGTLVDSQVDPADILATVLDLAQRGHLRITELATSAYQAPDWTFTRLDGEDDLKGYERLLLDALTTSQVKVCDLSASVGESIGAVQRAVYDEVLSAGWYSRLPSTRPRAVPWAWTGIAAATVAAGALVALTTFALAGLALVAVAVVALAVAAQVLPVTPTGAAVCAGLTDLSAQLHTHPVPEPGQGQYAQISRILPYAVVLGGWDRWLEALAAADDDPDPDPTDLSWYHAPADWHLRDLPDSLDSFITVVTGRLFARS